MWTSIRRAAGTLAVTALCTVPSLAQQRTQEQPKPADAKIKNPTGQPAEKAAIGEAQTQQQANERRLTRTVNKPVISNQSAEQVDQMIAGMLALCNEEEAAVGKFAAEHAQNSDVQKFATMMAKDHSQMAKQLQKWAPEATLTVKEEHAADSKAETDAPTLPFDPLQVHQRIASRSIASAEKMLGAKKGSDFDMAYIGSQCVTHQQLIDKASVLRQYASPELAQTIAKGIEGAQGHLEHAHELIEKLSTAERKSTR